MINRRCSLMTEDCGHHWMAYTWSEWSAPIESCPLVSLQPSKTRRNTYPLIYEAPSYEQKIITTCQPCIRNTVGCNWLRLPMKQGFYKNTAGNRGWRNERFIAFDSVAAALNNSYWKRLCEGFARFVAWKRCVWFYLACILVECLSRLFGFS